jgi:homoserine dehydrogenase
MRIGIIGVGTVGGGVVKIIEQKRDEFHAKFGICKHTDFFKQDLGIIVGISSCKL